MTSKSLNLILFSVQILLLLGSVVFLSRRILLPYSYIILSGLLTFLCAVIVMMRSESDSKIPLTSIIITGLYFRNVCILAMGPNVIPLSDSYTDYAYTLVSLSKGGANIYTEQGGILDLQAVSQWPLLHVFTIELVQITGLELIWSASFVVPMIIQLISMVLVYIVTKYFLIRLGFEDRIVLTVTLLYALLPHTIYETIQFIRGNFGLLWIFLLLYVIARNFSIERPQKADAILSIIFATNLAVSHHYSALLFLLFLVVAWACNRILGSILRGVPKIGRPEKGPFDTCVCIYPVVLLVWWLYYGTLAFIYSRNLLLFFHLIGRDYIRQLEKSGSLVELRPLNIMSTILIRDMIVYGFIAMGILYFLFIFAKKFAQKNIEKEHGVMASSLVAVCSAFILAASLIGTADKAITFFAPILLIFSGFCFNKLIKTRFSFKVLLLIGLTISGVGVALAPYSHNYAPLYLYDTSIRPEETNTHNPSYWRVSSFLNTYIMNSSYVSDDGRLLYAVLPIQEFQYISSLGLSSDYGDLDDGTVIVRFGNYPSDRSFWTIASLNADEIYTSGLPEIWIKR